ncbi:unnamed protein product [Agarophyton chilense]
MGCVPSAPQSDRAEPHRPPRQPTTPSARPTAPAHSAAKPTAAAYETELAASLAEGDATSVAYHGLLNDRNAISLARSTQSPLHKLADRSLSPTDLISAPHPELVSVASGVAMTMPYTVIVAQPNEDARLSQLVTDVFQRYNAVLNAWNPHSEISNINALAPGKKAPVSPQLQRLFAIVDQVFDITDARFDPTTAVLNIAFENCIRDKKRPPLPNELLPFKHALGWKRRVQRNDHSVSRTNANTMIDLDGISKGYVIDCIVQCLLDHGFQDIYVDWAADIRALGKHPSGRPWRAALIQPPQLQRVFNHWREGTLSKMLNTDDIAYLASFEFEGLYDVSMATSGDYFCVQKYGYHHIARSSDLSVMKSNINSVASVCIAASTCAVADAVATAVMTFDAVSDAFEFCARLCRTFPTTIYGFRVMGRDSSANQSVFSPPSPLFEQVALNSNQQSRRAGHDGGNDDSRAVSPLVMEKLRRSIFANAALVVCGERSEQTESLVSLSMSPQQIVSFQATRSFVSQVGDDCKCECLILGDESPFGTLAERISLDLRVKDVYSVGEGDGAVVVASIDQVSLGSIDSVKVVHGDQVLATKEIALSCARSRFELAPLIDQSRDVFRNFASMIWIITTSSVEQQPFALTATSVSVAECMNDVVCFNIVHTSAFYAALGGVGSQVGLYALSSELRNLAVKYTGQSSLEQVDATRLVSGSLAVVEGSVIMVKDVQDHHVVAVRAQQVRLNGDVNRPLIWLQGSFA